MKKVNFLSPIILFFLSVSLSSCQAIAGIFKAGMGFGIFIVLAVVALVIFIAMRVGKNKN